jgi:hypothetical protein
MLRERRNLVLMVDAWTPSLFDMHFRPRIIDEALYDIGVVTIQKNFEFHLFSFYTQ